jgi:endogenous inhibitor of DNA gyrase (YacG/DUF329 family)
VRTCERCGARFEGKRADARFCSEKCRLDHWLAEHPEAPRSRSERLSQHPRRRSRDGNGTRLYLSPLEVAYLIDVLVDYPDTRDAPLQGVLAKLAKAHDRIEENG